MSRQETYTEYLNQLSPESLEIVKLYQSVAAAFNDLYQVILDRTTYKEWENPFRTNPEDLGIGDCHLSTKDSEQEIDDKNILHLRNLRSDENPGSQYPQACGHHRRGRGCVLGDLKSPYCLRYFRNPLLDEMRRRFGKGVLDSFNQARSQAMKALKDIQGSSFTGDQKTEIAKTAIMLLTTAQKEIAAFPILTR